METSNDVSGLVFTVSNKSINGEGGIKLSEDEWLPAILTQFVPFESMFGKQIRWMFELQGKEYTWKSSDGKTGQFKVSGNTTYACSPKSKLYKWYSKLMGKEPAEGEKIELKTLIGKSCFVTLKINKKTNNEGEEVVYNNVIGVKIGASTVAPATVAPVTTVTPQTNASPAVVVKEEVKPAPKEGDIFEDIF